MAVRVIAGTAYLCASCSAARADGAVLPHRDEDGCTTREAGRERPVPWSAQVLACPACLHPPARAAAADVVRRRRVIRGQERWLCDLHGGGQAKAE